MQITRLGVLWDEAALAGLLKTKVPVCYGGESVLLNRARVAYGVAYWHGVAFTASRRGLIALMFDQEWRARYATPGKRASVPLDAACAVLKVGKDYTHEAVLAAFRREAKKVHPDPGGAAEQFRALVAACARLLATLGT